MDYISKFKNKIINEYQDYKNDLVNLNSEEIFNKSYESVIKKDLMYAIESCDLTSSECKRLLSLSNPLDDLYHEWLNNDYSYLELLRDTVKEESRRIEKIQSRNYSGLEL